ncbi:hypothetical protein INR49_020359 [Caranx melampygus]|nr:hypothetical protein INR49_020359 [Caranx melampygus]
MNVKWKVREGGREREREKERERGRERRRERERERERESYVNALAGDQSSEEQRSRGARDSPPETRHTQGFTECYDTSETPPSCRACRHLPRPTSPVSNFHLNTPRWHKRSSYDECVGPGSAQIYIPTDDPPPYSLLDPCQRGVEQGEEPHPDQSLYCGETSSSSTDWFPPSHCALGLQGPEHQHIASISFRWRRRHRTSRFWPSRASPSPSCHVTL